MISSAKSSKERKRDAKRDSKEKDDDKSSKIKTRVPPPPPPNVQQTESKTNKLTIKDIPNYKKKVVVSNLPLNVSIDEVETFLNTYINTLRALSVADNEGENNDNQEQGPKKPSNMPSIESIEIREGVTRYAIISFISKEDIEH